MTKEQISRIVRGNDFSMEITVLMPEYEVNATQWTDFDISSCNNVAVNLICTKDQVVIPLDWHIKENTNNVIIADVKGKYLHSGTVYSLEITGLDSEGRAWRYKNKQVFSIVDSTSQAALAPTLMADPLELNATVCLAVKVMPIEVEGPQGVTGLQGPTGPAGEKGQDGTISFDELTPEQKESLVGEQGVTGLQGEVGPRGVRGVTGQVGPTGRQGVTGTKGVTGQQGVTGQRGPTGPTGRQGVTGLKGVTGLQGIQGVTGMTGPIGRQGATGARGVTGAKGLMGDDGITTLYDAARDLGVYEGNVEDFPEVLVQWSYAGDEAIQEMNQKQDTLVSGRNIKTINGESLLGSGNITIEGGAGTSGPQGVTGAQGPQGVTGAVGPQGPAGNDGQDGQDGTQGPQGVTGAVGPKGVTGIPGTTDYNELENTPQNLSDFNDDIGLYEISDNVNNLMTEVYNINEEIKPLVGPYPKEVDYSQEYLTFEVLDDGVQFSFTNNDIYYSTDGAGSWTLLTAGQQTEGFGPGDKICWKCTSPEVYTNSGMGTFSANGSFNVYGNISSIVLGYPDISDTLTLQLRQFAYLFNNNTYLINASKLILPSTTLADFCYQSMFSGCTGLIAAPDLPATTLSDYCYYHMLDGCTSLTTAPELPATTLTSSCYHFMFRGCTSLQTAPELPATTLANKCYYYMFHGCSNLNYIKCLATDISANNCTYEWVMYVSPTGTFITNDNSPAWTTGYSGIPTGWNVYTETEYSYVRHYELSSGPQGVTGAQGPQGVTGAIGPQGVTGAVGPAGNDGQDGQDGVQGPQGVTGARGAVGPQGVTGTIGQQGVTGAPGTTNYNELENTPQSLEDLDYGAAEQLSANTWAISDIQTQLDLIDYSIEYLTFEVLDDNATFKFSTNALYYSINDEPEETLEPDTWTPTLYAGDKIRFYATISSASTSTGIGTFSATGRFKAYGNIMSIVTSYPSAAGTFTLLQYQFYKLFENNTYLVDASKLILPATTLTRYCYSYMFMGCSNLQTAPELPATTLANYCYNNMFRNCTSLTTAPELPATTLAEYCYNFMFGECSSLTSAPELPATTLVSNCYYFMFYGCTSLNYIKCLATNISASSCTQYWVINVSQTGIFITNDNPPAWTTGNNGIPTGWNACTEAEYSYVRHYELSSAPQGVTGIQGPQGETGPTGPQGVTGIPGTTDYNELENRPNTSYFVQSVGTTGMKIEVVQTLPVNPDSSTIYIIQ